MADDREYMQRALEEAYAAATENEVPVGAVLVYEERVIARGHNRMIQRKDALAHAELMALQAAALVHPHKWLLDTTLYVTLEPCLMCAGALVLARVARVVFAAADPKAGALGSTVNVFAEPHVNHRPEVTAGVLADESTALIKEFFRTLREK
ncbi:MAG TPA: tRNA adenosine(34) deaminase TadA [Acidobacteriota bacterium]|nr:tRNA adenosine(34) deaminase TadA [Acidobacteriota bacterium]